MNDQATLVSKVLVLDSDAECHKRIKSFCEENNLIGLKARADNIVPVLQSNIDLGGILLSETGSDNACGGIALARTIHRTRPELPIFLRREATSSLEDLAENDRALFSAAYTINDTAHLRNAIGECLFGLIYPNALVHGIAELAKSVLEGQFRGMKVAVETPYMVRDKLIFGEIFTLIPIESRWCRGYMMLQVEEDSLLRLAQADRTPITPYAAHNFRNLNHLLSELTNLMWGAFKNRYISSCDNNSHTTQIPIVVNHLHRYISFGSDDPQLCFKYTLSDRNDKGALSMTVFQRFVFNLNWSPEDFQENQTSVEALFDSGELELF